MSILPHAASIHECRTLVAHSALASSLATSLPRRYLWVLISCAFGAALVLTATISRDPRSNTAATIPTEERRVLYGRILQTLREQCANNTTDALDDYCREQAEFVSRFPECDTSCRESVQRFAPHATR
jgi:hypothetical protein